MFEKLKFETFKKRILIKLFKISVIRTYRPFNIVQSCLT